MEFSIGITELESEFCPALEAASEIRACWRDSRGDVKATPWLNNSQTNRRTVSDCLESLALESRVLNVNIAAWIETKNETKKPSTVRPEPHKLRLVADNTKRQRKP